MKFLAKQGITYLKYVLYLKGRYRATARLTAITQTRSMDTITKRLELHPTRFIRMSYHRTDFSVSVFWGSNGLCLIEY